VTDPLIYQFLKLFSELVGIVYRVVQTEIHYVTDHGNEYRSSHPVIRSRYVVLGFADVFSRDLVRTDLQLKVRVADVHRRVRRSVHVRCHRC
jgi:hypothetical protein